MGRIKSASEIEMMRLAGMVVAQALGAMRDIIVPGVTTTLDLDEVAAEVLRRNGARSAFAGYKPSFSSVAYRYHTCLSVNDEVVHGVPSAERVLREGDIITLDMGATIDGWYADSAITVPVGVVSSAAKNLLLVAREALNKGIAQARPGNAIGDIGAAIEHHAHRSRYGVVRELVGHGIGSAVHEEPQVPNHGRPGTGVRLEPGMTICIEPMVNLGGAAVRHRPGDDWTICTSDGSLSAHFEHTVAIMEEGPDILTLPCTAAK
ncbi:MAG: type I methionyl aminopeptidase [Capsulimonadaceae bacterium]